MARSQERRSRRSRSEPLPRVTTTTARPSIGVSDAGCAAAVEQQVALPPQVLGGGVREGLQLGAEAGPGRLHRQRDRGGGQQLAAADQLLAPVERVAVEPQPVAVVQQPDDLGADPVEHRDAGLDEQLRARGWGSGR